MCVIDQNKDVPSASPPPSPMEQGIQPDTQKSANRRDPSVLCLLDHVLGNMVIHYLKTRVVHPRQGLDDILEIVKEENLITSSIKLIYLLVG